MNDNFYEQQKEVLHLLKLLNDNKILPHVILAGSWAEYAYAQSGLLPGFTLALRTVDLDFLIKNLRRPSEEISLPAIAKENGYTIGHDRLMGTTKFISPGGLEVEFLIAQKGSGIYPILKTNLGVSAQALRHMEDIISNAITVDVLGIDVQVPCPEMYVLHKMLINDSRKPLKQEKDRISISRLLPHINFQKTEDIYNKMTKKEKNRIQEFIKTFGQEVSRDMQLDKKIEFMNFVAACCSNISKDEIKTIFRAIEFANR